ncbi:hypothetical protein ON010_g1575 [Phytophthora cinnamomi]|nr:hypothetical protein ON010_g1575 [Phytophthora cinnamomi]
MCTALKQTDTRINEYESKKLRQYFITYGVPATEVYDYLRLFFQRERGSINFERIDTAFASGIPWWLEQQDGVQRRAQIEHAEHITRYEQQDHHAFQQQHQFGHTEAAPTQEQVQDFPTHERHTQTPEQVAPLHERHTQTPEQIAHPLERHAQTPEQVAPELVPGGGNEVPLQHMDDMFGTDDEVVHELVPNEISLLIWTTVNMLARYQARATSPTGLRPRDRGEIQATQSTLRVEGTVNESTSQGSDSSLSDDGDSSYVPSGDDN